MSKIPTGTTGATEAPTVMTLRSVETVTKVHEARGDGKAWDKPCWCAADNHDIGEPMVRRDGDEVEDMQWGWEMPWDATRNPPTVTIERISIPEDYTTNTPLYKRNKELEDAGVTEYDDHSDFVGYTFHGKKIGYNRWAITAIVSNEKGETWEG